MWTCTFLNSVKADVAMLIRVDFGKSEFFNIYIYNGSKALYSGCSSIFWHIDFIRAIAITSCSFQNDASLRQAAMSL